MVLWSRSVFVLSLSFDTWLYGIFISEHLGVFCDLLI